jgi:proteic killer suppression protein
MAIRTFNNIGTEDVFFQRNTAKARRQVEKQKWPLAYTLLHVLNTVPTLQALAGPPGVRLEAVTYNKPGYHSVRVCSRFRIVFIWKDGDAYDVSCEDPRYHQS